MHYERKANLPRAKGLSALVSMKSSVTALNDVVAKLPKNQDKFQALVDACLRQLQDGLIKVKTDPNITDDAIKEISESIQKDVDNQLAALKKEQERQGLEEEAARLKKIEDDIAAEKARAEAEANGEVDVLKGIEERAALEEKNKKEAEKAEAEEERLRMEEEKLENSEKHQSKVAKLKEQENAERDQLEQERRDLELAMRLAGEEGGLSEEAAAQARTDQAKQGKGNGPGLEFDNKKQAAIHKKLDLSKWKYADLKDTINTSTDPDLLAACREEFQRRLQQYHEWKQKNLKKGRGANVASRAPEDVMAGSRAGQVNDGKAKVVKRNPKGVKPQRYFRIPSVVFPLRPAALPRHRHHRTVR